ncbi:MAG: hypothetical protein JST44_22140 [Cyanobacteria bacterium SZAS LIN-5]|nr:hypothetical protein [Cyanobacteria bacterium SZAS LIN-5]
MTNETAKKTGFQNMVSQRDSMQSWTHVRTLLNHGINREAAAIVESFQRQMDFEQSQYGDSLAQVAA